MAAMRGVVRWVLHWWESTPAMPPATSVGPTVRVVGIKRPDLRISDVERPDLRHADRNAPVIKSARRR